MEDWVKIDPSGEWVTTEQYDSLQERYRRGLSEFLAVDTENRNTTLLKLKKVLQSWFEAGVEYRRQKKAAGRRADIPQPKPVKCSTKSRSVFGMKVYQNPPAELQRHLDIAAGQILLNILQWRRIPLEDWVGIVLDLPPVPQLKLKARTSRRVLKISYLTVWESEGTAPTQRAAFVANNWYDLQADSLFRFMARAYLKSNADNPRFATLAFYTDIVDHQISIDDRLNNCGVSNVGKLEYMMREEGFEFMEIADMLRAIGVKKTADGVRKALKKIELYLDK